MAEPAVLLAVVLTFLLAGTVKGVVGLGLPPVSVALLTVLLNLPTAMALLLAPSLATNLWQALSGGHALTVLRRTWPFLLMASATVWIGALALTRVDLPLLSALLGALLLAYAGSNLAGVRLAIAPRQERWLGPMLGSVNGVLTGMTGSFAVPGVLFLQAIGLPRDMLIQAMGMLFTVSTLALALALQGQALLSTELGLLSAAGVLPAVLGMWLGQKLRRLLSEQRFRLIFFVSLAALGLYILVRAIGAF